MKSNAILRITALSLFTFTLAGVPACETGVTGDPSGDANANGGNDNTGDNDNGANDNSGNDNSGNDNASNDNASNDNAGNDNSDAGANDNSTTDPTGDGEETGEGVDTGNGSTDVPEVEYCEAVAVWDAASSEFESRVLELINAHRADGAVCGSRGSFDPAEPLAMEDRLQCAARNHSMDMEVRNFFDHTNPDDESPEVRIDKTEYPWSTWGENIAWGQSNADSVVAGWMNSPGHCANIMNPEFTEIGVGHYDGSRWTQVFAAPR